MQVIRQLFTMVVLVNSGLLFAQTTRIPGTPDLSVPTVNKVPAYSVVNTTSRTKTSIPATTLDINNIQSSQHQAIINEVEKNEKLREQSMQDMKNDIAELQSAVYYDLPSYSNNPATASYGALFDKMLLLDPDNYSITDVNFQIENAYFNNRENEDEFDTVIRQIADFLKAKMKELGYNENSNLAKNYILFQFFSETLRLKATGQQHFPMKYDFNDFWGKDDWSKMFVTKLIKTGSGQCHSMPMLYLILAEQIGAEAYLALSPNHSYIKFQDEKQKWYNLELTNAMFTTNSFVLSSGFIKAEAMQNKLYMQSLSKKQLLSQLYTDLAGGYIHKFGYDEFVFKTIQKALELYPESINANLVLANYNTARFEYVMKQMGINPEIREQLIKIKDNPKAMELLMATQIQYRNIDESGYEYMPADAYEKWLASLKEAKNKQDNEDFTKQFKGLIKKHPKN